MAGKHIGTTYVIGNWKMHPRTPDKARTIFRGVKKRASYAREVTTVVCPPDHLLPILMRGYSGKKVAFGAQDVSVHEGVGSHTGDISAEMIAAIGTEYCIVGHSERRAAGEDNETVAQKAAQAAGADLRVVLCVGEESRDTSGQYLKHIQRQITAMLEELTRSQVKQLLIAYEPVWAIGGGDKTAMNAHELHQMTLYIRKVLLSTLPEDVVQTIPILYGGSVKRTNAAKLLDGTGINGFLVGGASLDGGHFSDIISIANDLMNQRE